MIKVERNEVERERKYPYLGKSKMGTVVLFLGAEFGICFEANESLSSAETSHGLNETAFEVWDGSITLSNA